MVADSTSVNLFKLLVAAARLSDRKTLLSESGNFHTDLHIASGVADLLGLTLDIAPRAEVEARIGAGHQRAAAHPRPLQDAPSASTWRGSPRKAKRGRRDDGLGSLAQRRRGAARISTSAGAELAVGCGYKYLNGGPGAPAFLYVAEASAGAAALARCAAGWAMPRPFAFTDDYARPPGIDRFLAGTPPILGLAALESGLDAFDGVTMERLWTKSRAMFDVFHGLMEQRCPELRCITPRGAEQRGSHISFAHSHAFEICQALIAAEVIGDFRAPDVIRFGLTPLYLGFEDIWTGVDRLAAIMASGSWRDPKFAVRAKVT